MPQSGELEDSTRVSERKVSALKFRSDLPGLVLGLVLALCALAPAEAIMLAPSAALTPALIPKPAPRKSPRRDRGKSEIYCRCKEGPLIRENFKANRPFVKSRYRDCERPLLVSPGLLLLAPLRGCEPYLFFESSLKRCKRSEPAIKRNRNKFAAVIIR